MVQCPTCGSEVSEQAAFCPDCGTDLKPTEAAGPGPAASPAVAPATNEPAASTPAATPEPELGIEAEPTPAPVADAEAAANAPAAPAPVAPPPAPPVEVTPAPPVEASAPAGARLILKRSGAATNEVFPIGGHVTIGRFDPETGPVDVDLGNLPEATYISRQHAELVPDGSGSWKIKDLGSRNGVFVRKQGGGAFQRVTGEETVGNGDEIALGNARFELRIG